MFEFSHKNQQPRYNGETSGAQCDQQRPGKPPSTAVLKRALSFLSPINTAQGDNRELTAPERLGHLLAEASIHPSHLGQFSLGSRTSSTTGLVWRTNKAAQKILHHFLRSAAQQPLSPGFILSWLLLKPLSLATRCQLHCINTKENYHCSSMGTLTIQQQTPLRTFKEAKMDSVRREPTAHVHLWWHHCKPQ